MKTTLDLNDFINAFADYGRGKSFSRNGFEALFDMLEGIDPDYELDVIALDCYFVEYESATEAANEYGFEPSDNDLDEDEIEEEALKFLNNHTFVLEFEGGVIIEAW